MMTATQGLVAATFVLAMVAFGTGTDAMAGGGHHHHKADRGHHGAHGDWHRGGRKKHGSPHRGKWKQHERGLTARQKKQLFRWHRKVVREHVIERDHRLTRRQWARIQEWRHHLDREHGRRPGRALKQSWKLHHHHSHHRRRDHRDWDHRHSGNSSRLPGFLNGGTVLGAIAGGVLGNQIGSGGGRVAATAGGALLGAIVGNEIHRGIQASDEARVARVLESTPSGQTISWKNPDTGNSFKVTPRPAFKGANQRDCREYTTWVFLGGYEKEITGIACRDSQGRWQLKNG